MIIHYYSLSDHQINVTGMRYRFAQKNYLVLNYLHVTHICLPNYYFNTYCTYTIGRVCYMSPQISATVLIITQKNQIVILFLYHARGSVVISKLE